MLQTQRQQFGLLIGEKMNEKRKQTLKQLLQAVIENLAILPCSPNPFQLTAIDVHSYRQLLQQHWKEHSFDAVPLVRRYGPHIHNESLKSELLDFIRQELAEFISEDRIQSASFFIASGGPGPKGYGLDNLLSHLLKIAIVHGIEEAVQEFDRCIQSEGGHFQYMAILEGIKLDAPVNIFEGIQLIPLPDTIPELQQYLSEYVTHEVQPWIFKGKTLLIIDASVSPIFHKPFPEIFREGFRAEHIPFKSEIVGGKFTGPKVKDFYKRFCQALSLVCNSAVQCAQTWRRLAEDKLFNLYSMRDVGHSMRDVGHSMRDVGLTRHYTANQSEVRIGENQIAEAKRLYKGLDDIDPSTQEKLQIPIERWIRSKADWNPVDKIIDLGIAFEALYLSGIDSKTELRFRFSLHAAWHLGEDKEQRKALMKEFKSIYDWRSTVVHTGKLPNKRKKTPFTPEEVEAFITKAQDLCRDSIMKILENEKFRDWNNLILGEESS